MAHGTNTCPHVFRQTNSKQLINYFIPRTVIIRVPSFKLMTNSFHTKAALVS